MAGRGPSVFKIMDWIIMKNENYNYIDNVIDIAQVVGRGPLVGLDNIQNDGLDNSGSFNDYDDVIDIAQVARRGPSIFKMMAWIVIIITMIMPRWRDVQNSINVLDYIGSFNDYDDVIYDAHLGEGGPLDWV